MSMQSAAQQYGRHLLRTSSECLLDREHSAAACNPPSVEQNAAAPHEAAQSDCSAACDHDSQSQQEARPGAMLPPLMTKPSCSQPVEGPMLTLE